MGEYLWLANLSIVLMAITGICFLYQTVYLLLPYFFKKKKDKTPEETEQCKKFFNNAVAFEKRVDDEIKRVQTIMEERTKNE